MSATLNALRPTRLDIVDLPRDPERCLGGLRAALCATFNYTKQYPLKLATFITVLEYVLERAKDIASGAVEEAVAAQEAARLAEIEAAEQAVIELRKAEIAEAVAGIKAAGKAIIVAAQEITVLEDLKQYVIVEGFEPEGDTVEDIKAAFVKAKTAQVLAQVADYKDSLNQKDEE